MRTWFSLQGAVAQTTARRERLRERAVACHNVSSTADPSFRAGPEQPEIIRATIDPRGVRGGTSKKPLSGRLLARCYPPGMALSQRIASLTVQPDVPATAKVAKRSARLAPISPMSAVDRAADELRHAIVRGTLKPGKSIIIRELAADLGISHIPIREALRRLESEGFLTLRHAHSAVVTPMSREDLGDIYRVRVLLEPEVVARAAKRFTERDFERMDTLVAALSVEMEVERSFELHQELHLALLRPGASSWELRILLALWAANERYLRAAVPCVVAGPAHDQGRHERLVQVARRRDAKKLKLEMKRHLEAGRQVVVDHMFPGDSALSD